MNKNELLKLIINSNIDDFDVDAVNYLLNRKTFSEYPMKNAETHSNCIEESSTSSAKSGLLKSSSFTNHENSFEDISVNKAVFTRSKEVYTPPYMISETKTVNWKFPTRDYGKQYPDSLVHDPMYKTVLMGDLKLTEYRERNKKYKKNYYIRSLKKALGVGNTKSLNSTKFVGLQFIDRAFKENTHMEYLKEMFHRLTYIIKGNFSEAEVNSLEFNLLNLKTLILHFLTRFSSMAFTAVYLFKSQFDIVDISYSDSLSHSKERFMLNTDQKIKLGDFVDSYYHDCTEEAAILGNIGKDVSLEFKYSSAIYLAFTKDENLERIYRNRLDYIERLYRRLVRKYLGNPEDAEESILDDLFNKIKFLESLLGVVRETPKTLPGFHL